MTRVRLRDPCIPPSLTGWVLVDDQGLPRYWATVWAALHGAALQESTLSAHLSVIESFYRSVKLQLNEDCLDRLIADLCFDKLERCLEGFFISLRNRSAQNGADHSGDWRTAIAFVRNCVERLARGSTTTPLDEVHSRLLRLERLYSSLSLRRKRRPEIARALPAAVIEDIYELIQPDSPRNPFRTEALRWRNFALVLLMLHQGLRRSETLVLAADAIKESLAFQTEGLRCWMDVVENPYEHSDSRADAPSIKNANSVRQIPVSDSIMSVVETYTANYRGRPQHSFLFSSQEGTPLSKRSVNAIFSVLSEHLSKDAVRELCERRKSTSVTPHALRHTCAVVRLTHLIDAGVEMDLALQKLRVFFGWSRPSLMPHHYARAYFEDRLATVWHDSFDLHVDALRRLSGRDD
ncbi:integrase [Pseudomonas aeruginosa]|nr:MULTISPECIES: tyrosine-type recombinase/integrase [Pseudomonadaceae]MAL90233.1 integrase [Pseudomonas sp.]QFU12479.1 site-specific tyrosine recombinase XerC [Stutzerimonas frequens]RTT35043.1 integrase [Pseudomonas paraeruginosa]HLC44790.1 tyrosine-type recombinase/integrase [Patescibacteria group bacterium]KAA2293651.1 phage integrase family protein [Pseudomonas aeruginosa]